MEREPFLPLSRVNWVTTKGTLLQLWSTACTLTLSVPHITHSLTCNVRGASTSTTAWERSKPTSTHNYTCDWDQSALLFSTSTNQYIGSFLCLDMEAVITLALVKPQCTKSTMPFTTCIKIPHPHIYHLTIKTDNSLKVNWLQSLNIKHKNHMGNVEIQIEVA